MRVSKEIWKDIPEYEGLYQVSNHGRVRSLDRYVQNGSKERFVKGRVLKLCGDPEGYYTISLCDRCVIKAYKVHRLVLMAFDRLPKTGEQCNHMDGIKSNNHRPNLEWCTHKENSYHRDNVLEKHNRGEKNPSCKLTEQKVKEIRILLEEGKFTQSQIAKRYKVNKSTIGNIKYGKIWRHVK